MARISLFLSIAVVILPAFAYGQGLVNLARPDANIVIGVRVAEFASSPLVRTFWNEAKGSKPELEQFLAAMGSNPLASLDEILIAAKMKDGASADQAEGLVLVRGRFDEQQLISALCEQGCETEVVHGYELRRALGKTEAPDHFAVLGGGQVAMGSAEEVRGVIQRRASGAAPTFSAGMSDWIRRLGHHHIWIAAAGPFPQAQPSGDNPGAQMFANFGQKVDGLGLGINVTNDVEMSFDLRATSAQDAKQFYDMVNGFIAMARAKEQKPDAQKFLDNLRLSQDGNVIAASLRIPEVEIRRQLAEQRAKRAQAGSEAGSETRPTWTTRQPPKRREGGIRIYGLGEEPVEVPTTKP